MKCREGGEEGAQLVTGGGGGVLRAEVGDKGEAVKLHRDPIGEAGVDVMSEAGRKLKC